MKGLCGGDAYQNSISFELGALNFAMIIQNRNETTWMGPVIIPLFPLGKMGPKNKLRIAIGSFDESPSEKNSLKVSIQLNQKTYEPSNVENHSHPVTEIYGFKTNAFSIFAFDQDELMAADKFEVGISVAKYGERHFPFSRTQAWHYMPIMPVIHEASCASR